MSFSLSLTELKRSAVALTENELRELAAFRLQLGRERNQAWRDETSRRMSEMHAGKKVTQVELERRAGPLGES